MQYPAKYIRTGKVLQVFVRHKAVQQVFPLPSLLQTVPREYRSSKVFSVWTSLIDTVKDSKTQVQEIFLQRPSRVVSKVYIYPSSVGSFGIGIPNRFRYL